MCARHAIVQLKVIQRAHRTLPSYFIPIILASSSCRLKSVPGFLKPHPKFWADILISMSSICTLYLDVLCGSALFSGFGGLLVS